MPLWEYFCEGLLQQGPALRGIQFASDLNMMPGLPFSDSLELCWTICVGSQMYEGDQQQVLRIVLIGRDWQIMDYFEDVPEAG